ncbi:MAG TPA: OB-fold domain-containing protein [Mycobacteriales bacterium]|jgi:hypothetical protein|nr:OB-fold domain-containing protein [Mycobacteriales bacterium]
MTASTFSAPMPLPDPETEGFWAATREGRLTISRCQSCRVWQHPPTENCRRCGGASTFEPVSGRGTVYSFIVIRQATVPGRRPPYVVALVELEEQAGLRLSATVLAEPDAVRVGMPVQALLEPVSDDGEFIAPSFVPSDG